jgi:hypothetical protein
VLGWVLAATVGLEGLWLVLAGLLVFGLALWWPRSAAPRSGLALLFTVQALAGCLSLPLTVAGSRRLDWTWLSVVALGLVLGAAMIALSLVVVLLLVYPWYLLAGSGKVPYPMLPKPTPTPTPTPAVRSGRSPTLSVHPVHSVHSVHSVEGLGEVGAAPGSAPPTRLDRVFVALFFLLLPVDAVTLTLALDALPGAPSSALASGQAMALEQLGMSHPGYAVRSPLLLWISRVALLLMVGALLALVVSDRRRRRRAAGDRDRPAAGD